MKITRYFLTAAIALAASSVHATVTVHRVQQLVGASGNASNTEKFENGGCPSVRELADTSGAALAIARQFVSGSGPLFEFVGIVEGTSDSYVTSAKAETFLTFDIEVTGQPETLTVIMSILSTNFRSLASFLIDDVGPMGQTWVGPWHAGNGDRFDPGTVQVELPLGHHQIRLGANIIQPARNPGTAFVKFEGSFNFSNMVLEPGATQHNPFVGSGNTFTGVLSNLWFDPPLAQGYTFTATGTALFKDITSFPSGIQGSYYVTTEGTSYGPFTPNQSVDLSALRGHGVSSFVLRGIKPFVDATSPVAFPIMLNFTAEPADFTMVPIAAPDLQMETLANGDLKFTFSGVLQSSPDLSAWNDVTPAPTSPYVLPKAQVLGARYFRSRDP